jgi:hypothetical protein
LKHFVLLMMAAAASALALPQINDNLYTADGPAELPRIRINTALWATPSPGTTVSVAAGSNLQAAYNAAACGQTLALAVGTWQGSGLTLGPKGCDDQHWITIKTDSTQLPAEGTRAALSNQSQMATILMKSGATQFLITGDHLRFIDVAWLKAVGGTHLNAFVETQGANHIIFDRVIMHGNPKEETTRSIGMTATAYLSVIDSWLDEDHCIAGTGACTDAQTITTADGPGPYKFVNNYLSASGETILLGGGAATTTPCDVEIRQNHMDKPLAWNPKDSGFAKPAYIVKNLLELKNACRVLVEGNVMTGSWGGFSQSGYAIVLTPKNQAGVNGVNLCPTCFVTDITIRYNHISHVGAGISIANVASDNGGTALDGQRYSIHDITIDDMNAALYSGSGALLELVTGPKGPLLQNVWIDHVTASPTQFLMLVGAFPASSGVMKNFRFTNNLVTSGQYPVWSTGGGTVNCAYFGVPLTTYTACFANSVFAGNVITSPKYGAAKWPTGNTITATVPTPAQAGVSGANVGLVTQYTQGVN